MYDGNAPQIVKIPFDEYPDDWYFIRTDAIKESKHGILDDSCQAALLNKYEWIPVGPSLQQELSDSDKMPPLILPPQVSLPKIKNRIYVKHPWKNDREVMKNNNY